MEQLVGILPFVAIMGVMYFMMIRPQQKQRKERTAMMEALKKGDRVVTVGGMYGIVRAIRDERVTLEVASGIFVQFTQSAIGQVVRSESRASSAPDPELVGAADTAPDDLEDAINGDE